MKHIILLFLLLLNKSLVQGQSNSPLVSLKQLQGIWEGNAVDRTAREYIIYKLYLIVKGNKALKIYQDYKNPSSFRTYSNPFSYIGFDNDKIPQPKKISDLLDKGSSLCFYHVQGKDYDNRGNILPSATMWGNYITYNEDMEDREPGDTSNYLRLYGTGPDDFEDYVNVTKVADAFLLQLHKYDKVLWRRYLAFEGLKEKKIIVKKASIYSKVDDPEPTKMYLIEGDVFVALEEKKDRIKIRYFGKKVVEGWINKNEAN